MSDAAGMAVMDRGDMTFLEQSSVWATWLLGGAAFLTVGWTALRPDDPFGGVSLWSRSSGMSAWCQIVALTAAVSALGTVMAGRKSVDAGALAAALGLAAVPLRGATSEYFLIRAAESAGGASALAMRFAAEACAWGTAVLAALAVSAMTARWFFGPRSRHDEIPSLADAPGFGRWLSIDAAERTPVAGGLKHFAIALAVGLVAFQVLSTGSYARAIEHGQACFVVAGAAGVGAYVAHRVAPVRSALWSVLAALLLGPVGFAAAIVSSGSSPSTVLPVTIPVSHFLRALPIQFAAAGTVAAIAVTWHMAAIRAAHGHGAPADTASRP